MTTYQNAIFLSSQDSIHSAENSLNTSRNQDQDSSNKINYLQLKSPAAEMNLAAQHHFNNKTIHNSSGNNNITFEQHSSQISEFRKERSLLSPGVERQFSQLDEFLKQTYEKHGVYQLIRSFVDMEDQLVSTFEYLKKIQRNKNYIQEAGKNKVRCFQEINQIDQFSYQAEESIIHQFLYNLQGFFVPLQIKQESSQVEKSGGNFSFSQNKPLHLENSMITGKKNQHIHTSRSKHVIGAGLRSKRNIFSDEKMIQSININKPITPLQFQDTSFNRNPPASLKKTNSQVIGEESLQSQNIYLGNQQELLKTIFELRQQIYALKQAKTPQNATSSQNSSFYMDGSIGEHNFRNKDNEHDKSQTFLLQNSKEKQSFSFINRSDSKQKTSQIITSLTYPIVIKEDLSNENSQEMSRSTFKLSMLESVSEESDKENNMNSMNIQDLIRNKNPILKDFCKQTLSKPKFTDSNLIQSNALQFSLNQQKKSQSECLNNVNNETDSLVLKILEDFKRFFKVEMEIQLILLKTIKTRLPLQKSVYASFEGLIEWYSDVKFKRGSKIESVERFSSECLHLKTEILDVLKRNYKKGILLLQK